MNQWWHSHRNLFVGCRPITGIEFGEVQDPKKVGLLNPKSGLLNLTPLTLLQKLHFWPILWLKVDLLADWGASYPPGYGPGWWGLSDLTNFPDFAQNLPNFDQNKQTLLKFLQIFVKILKKNPGIHIPNFAFILYWVIDYQARQKKNWTCKKWEFFCS